MPSARPVKKITMSSVWKMDDGRKTQGLKRGNGLGKEDLMKNKRGKIVSKEAAERGQKAYKGSNMEKWTKCVTQAKKDHGIVGFHAVAAGTALYDTAWAYWSDEKKLPK